MVMRERSNGSSTTLASQGPVHAVAVGSFDGQDRIVSAADDGTVRVWDLGTGAQLARLTGHTGAVRAVAVGTLNGQDRIVSAGADGTVRVWDPESGLALDPITSHTAGVSLLHDSIVSVGVDGLLVVQPLGAAASDLRAHTALISDEASARDRIGSFALVAQAVADFLLDPDTEPPVTIGVKGAWGGGKSSMMLMIRDRIDPEIKSGQRRGIVLERSRLSRWGRLIAVISGKSSELSTGVAYSEQDSAPDLSAHPDGLADSEGAERVWRPSVWFNPWHYQTGEQVWAGLAMTLTEQITARMNRMDRERFFLRLNLARMDRDAVRRRIHGIVWRRLALPLAGLLAAALLAGLIWSVSHALAGFSIAAVVAFGGSLLSVLRTPVKDLYPALVDSPVRRHVSSALGELAVLPDLIDDPAHRTMVGYPYLAYVDVKRVIDLVTTPRRPLVIFIDDLDRCTPSVVTQMIEALNLFLAGPFKNCTFVMAVEPAVLAAYIASVYDKVGAFQDESAADRAQQFGWLFLEKMVQLPVVVPRPTPQQAASYLTDLLPPVPRPATPELADPGTGSMPRDRPTPMSQRQLSVADQPAAASSPDAAQRRAGVDESDASDLLRGGAAKSVPPLAARERLARNLAAEQAYHDACEWAAKNLLTELNPRRLKRLLAMIQLYALIGNRLGYLSTNNPQALTGQLRHVGVLAALNIRWPHLVDNLLAPESGDPDAPLVIEQLQHLRTDAYDSPSDHEDLLPPGRRDQLPEELLKFTSKHRDALDMIKQLMTLRPAEEIADEHPSPPGRRT